ncbi:hypothetical protein [Streptomyces sp. NPDC058657]|uniref:hypothetical protein n=1 Tax=unclassified Streptomyces TaxID=2593676 RepID=UPI0036544F3C
MTASKAKQAEVATRRAALVRLRRAGIPFEDERILSLGYSSRTSASKDLIRALEERHKDQAAAVAVYRQEENERLDALIQAAWPVATAPSPILDKDGTVVGEALDLKAIDTVLKVMDRRAKLNGYDMPVKTELSGPDGGGVPLGPVNLAELRSLIQAAGDPDPDPVDDSTEEGHDDSDDT